MIIVYIGIGIFVAVLMAACLFFFLRRAKSTHKETQVEVEKENLETLAAYVRAQKEQAEDTARMKELRKAEQKQKLETFKQTRDQLREKLQSQINAKEWKPLDAVLRSADKGGVGIYILYNETKDKYYVGQAKQLFKRVRDHFNVENMARDFLTGDKFAVKFLTANELDSDYRLDHIEKTGIEIYGSDKGNGYNKTTGNL